MVKQGVQKARCVKGLPLYCDISQMLRNAAVPAGFGQMLAADYAVQEGMQWLMHTDPDEVPRHPAIPPGYRSVPCRYCCNVGGLKCAWNLSY